MKEHLKLKIDQNKQNVIFSYLFFWEERRKTFRKNSTNCNLYFAKNQFFFIFVPSYRTIAWKHSLEHINIW